MTVATFYREASRDEMAKEIDRRGRVIELLEAEIERLREAARLWDSRPGGFDGPTGAE